MAIAFVAAGALADSTDQLDLALPAGTSAGHILIAVANTDQVSAVTATGWTSILDADGNIAEKLSVLWRRSDGADPTVFEFPGGLGVGLILGFSGCVASGDAIGVVGGAVKASASATVTALGITPPSDNNGILFIAIAQDASAIRTCSGYSGASPALTEVFDGGLNDALLGLNLSIAVALGVQATAAATGNRTATLSAAPVENQGVMISLKPFVAGGGAVPRGYRRPLPQVK